MQIFYPRNAKAAVDYIKSRLMKHQITNLSPARQFLGIDIQRHTDGSISLGQPAYFKPILKRFQMEDAHPFSTPLDLHTRLDGISGTALDNNGIKLYQAIVGSLMCAALATRPDIAFAVVALCRYNASPQAGHLTAARRVLRYLKATADHRLLYRKSTNGRLIGFIDSD